MNTSNPKDRDIAARRRKKTKERDQPRLTAHSSALESSSHAYSETNNNSSSSHSRTGLHAHSFSPSQQSTITNTNTYPSSSQESFYHADYHAEQHHYSSSQITDPRSSQPRSTTAAAATSSSSSSSPKSHELAHHLGRSFQYILSYLWELVLGTLLILRPIFSFLLALVIILCLLGALTRSLVVVRTEFQARVMCKIPGLSHFLECPTSSYYGSSSLNPPIPDFADLINKQVAAQELFADSLNALHPDLVSRGGGGGGGGKKGGRGFVGRTGKNTRIHYQYGQRQGRREGKADGQGDEDQDQQQQQDEEEDPYGLMVLLPKSGGKPLPLLLKQAELATVDLLKEQLEKFHLGAKATSRQMQFLQVEANAYMDVLRIKNVYLIAALDRLEQQQQRTMMTTATMSTRDGGASGSGMEKEGLGVIGGIAVLWDRVWDFFTGSYELQTVASEQKLQSLYQTTMEEARTHIRDLIVKAQDLLQSLDALDQIMSSIHEITTQERRAQKTAHGEVLSQLWSKLGGNRLQRGLFEENLGLLQDIGVQRKLTVGQIQTALLKLTDFEAEIGVLRERVVNAVVGMSVDGSNGNDETVTGSGSSSDGDSGQETGSGGQSPSSGTRVGTSTTLRAHIEHIMRVTDRMKERSFLADTMVKNENADQKPVGSVAGDEDTEKSAH